MKRACVLLADGFEEIEAMTPIDFLRRAGVEVLTLGVTGLKVSGSHGIVVIADTSIDKAPADFDAVIVPGGMPGSRNLAANPMVIDLIQRQYVRGALVSAICAAPAYVLHSACGILQGRRFTGYPGTEKLVTGGVFIAERVVQDGNIITSQGPGTAAEFSLAIVTELVGKEAAEQLAFSTLVRRG